LEENGKATEKKQRRVENFLYNLAAVWQLIFLGEFVMTFKKPKENFNKSAQAVFEYVIITAVAIAAVFVFTNASSFQKVQASFRTAIATSVTEINK